jgi:hypothetical protein
MSNRSRVRLSGARVTGVLDLSFGDVPCAWLLPGLGARGGITGEGARPACAERAGWSAAGMPASPTSVWPGPARLARGDNPVAALNHAVTVSMVSGAGAGLELLRRLEADPRMTGNRRFHAVRAHLLERDGNPAAALIAYQTAARHATNAQQQRYPSQQIAGCRTGPEPTGAPRRRPRAGAGGARPAALESESSPACPPGPAAARAGAGRACSARSARRGLATSSRVCRSARADRRPALSGASQGSRAGRFRSAAPIDRAARRRSPHPGAAPRGRAG